MLLAQNLNAIQSAGLPGYKLPTTPGGILRIVLPYVFYGAAIGLLIYLVMGGLQLMTSRGDPKGIAAAQTKMTNAFIGFVIVFFSSIIVSVIGKLFGIQFFTNIFG